MTDVYAENILLRKFKELPVLFDDVHTKNYVQSTEYYPDELYYSLDENGEYVISNPQPTEDNFTENDYYEVESYPSVAFPNEDFNLPDDGYWFEVYPIPAIPFTAEIGMEARSRWLGILQINVCVPKNGGTKSSNARYEEIAKLFRRDSIIEGVRITKVSKEPFVDDGTTYMVPVSVHWQADIDK